MPVTAKQRRVYDFIRRYLESNQEPPTMAEIGRQFQMSSSASVHASSWNTATVSELLDTNPQNRQVSTFIKIDSFRLRVYVS